jgi:hypothetical protein
MAWLKRIRQTCGCDDVKNRLLWEDYRWDDQEPGDPSLAIWRKPVSYSC